MDKFTSPITEVTPVTIDYMRLTAHAKIIVLE